MSLDRRQGPAVTRGLIGDAYSQNPRDLPTLEAAIDAGRLPVWRGMQLDSDDVVRADAIQQLMCRGAIDIAALENRHDIEFDSYFSTSYDHLASLAADGLVEISGTEIRATSRGRLLLRIIAACFDRYLQQSPADPARFSKAI